MSEHAQKGHFERVLDDVRAERKRQDEKWGEQNHPDVDQVLMTRPGGCTPQRMAEEYEIPNAGRAKVRTDLSAHDGQVTWAHIAVEELAEAVEAAVLGKEDDVRTEVVQLAAVCVQWVQAIDRRRDVVTAQRGDFERLARPAVDAAENARVDAIADEIPRHRDVLTAAGEHGFRIGCTCGWDGGTYLDYTDVQHRQAWRLHRADAIVRRLAALGGAAGETQTATATSSTLPAPAPVQGSDGLRDANNVAVEDVRAIAEALGIGGHARPYSAHEVVQRKILPALRSLHAAEFALQRVRELHVPWYTIHGVRHDHTVMANCEDFDGCDGTADRDCDDAGEHERLACVECRHVFEDVDGNLFWPCPTARALGSQPTGGQTC